MLGYAGGVDVSAKPHQQNLKRPPTRGLRDWRSTMAQADVEAFEAVAGDLLCELSYDRATARPGRRGRAAARARLVRYVGLTAAWRGAGYALRRSPLWRRRHPPRW